MFDEKDLREMYELLENNKESHDRLYNKVKLLIEQIDLSNDFREKMQKNQDEIKKLS